MEVGFVGLGRMGGAMVQRLLQDGHRVIAYNRSPERLRPAVEKGAVAAKTLAEMIDRLALPRTVWLMVPAGEPTEAVFQAVLPLLGPGDIVIDGGNSFYKDSVRRARAAEEHGCRFLDVGTSGGVWGLENGYCLMVGGPEESFRRTEPLFRTLAPEGGYAHVGPSGAGHFLKMVHNGIEYGLLQAYAEGFELLQASPYDMDFGRVAALWNRGSVVRSWLLELAERALRKEPGLAGIRGIIEDSGEGRWFVQETVAAGVPAPVITLALQARFRSQQEESFAARFIAALRGEFGGHAIPRQSSEALERHGPLGAPEA